MKYVDLVFNTYNRDLRLFLHIIDQGKVIFFRRASYTVGYLKDQRSPDAFFASAACPKIN